MEVTIKEFKEWLDNFPKDAILEVAVQEPPSAYQSYGHVSFESPELTTPINMDDGGDGWEVFDFSDDKKWAGHIYKGKILLRIGEAH